MSEVDEAHAEALAWDALIYGRAFLVLHISHLGRTTLSVPAPGPFGVSVHFSPYVDPDQVLIVSKDQGGVRQLTARRPLFRGSCYRPCYRPGYVKLFSRGEKCVTR